MDIKVENVAKYFYDKNNKYTDKQIQKLTYYAYAWYLTKYKTRLFDEQPQAWIHGPVFMSLYKTMQNDQLKNADSECVKKDKKIFNLLEIVYKYYGELSGKKLEAMTHIEDPWKNTRKGLKNTERSRKIISDEEIIAYYGA